MADANPQRAEQIFIEFPMSYEILVSALTMVGNLARSMLTGLGNNKPSRGPQWFLLANFDLGFLTVLSDYGLTHSVFSVLYVTFPNRWLVSIEGLFLFTGGICHSALAWDLGLLSFSIRLGDFPQVH
jgi:hypothetical protein